MKKQYHLIAVILFLILLFVSPICFLLQKDKEFSESENRYLAEKPLVSVENLLSGKFMDDMEKYIDDQFPQRTFWISFKSDFLRFIGSKEINGVYLAEDGYLIEKWLTEEFDKKQLAENIEVINSFSQRHQEQTISVMLIPTASMILNDKLPKNAPVFDQQIAYDYVSSKLNGIRYIDLNPSFLSHCSEDLYYKTDHHWTTYGAFLAYIDWCKANDSTANRNAFHTEIVTDTFQGSLHSKVLGNYCAYDKIEIYKRNDEPLYDVEYDFGKAQSNTIYAIERLSQKDKYQVFLNGNHSEVTIRISQENGKHLLIIKDSFANAFVPFLLNDYERIHIIDPRYYNGNIDEYMLENDIDECLFLYNIKNFCEDKNMSDILN